MDKNIILGKVLFHIVGNQNYFNDTEKAYKEYLKELLYNEDFLIIEYFNTLDIPESKPCEWFFSLIQNKKLTLANLLDFVDSLCYLSDIEQLEFIKWISEVWK